MSKRYMYDGEGRDQAAVIRRRHLALADGCGSCGPSVQLAGSVTVRVVRTLPKGGNAAGQSGYGQRHRVRQVQARRFLQEQ